MSEFKRTLMQHHDGELGAIASTQLERRLHWDASGREYLQELVAVGDGIRETLRARTDGVDLTDEIMRRVERERELERRAHRSRRARARLGLALGSSAALAAGALFWLLSGVGADGPARLLVPHRPATADVSVAEGVAIESVDFGVGGGSIFVIQGGEATTPVVWLTEPTEDEARSEPL